jgi:hypothetical protein
MGLFGFGKKKEEKPAEAAADSQKAQASSTDAPAENGAEMKKCEMCGEMKPASEGKMLMEGTAFRCNDCAEKEGGDDHGEVCEFC